MTDLLYVRAPEVVLVGNAVRLMAIHRNGQADVFSGSIEDTHAVLALLSEPKRRPEVASCLGWSDGQAASFLEGLQRLGMIKSGTAEQISASTLSRAPIASKPICRNLVFALCGTIQAAASIGVPFMLKGTFASEVDVILTPAATKFIPRQVVSYLGLPLWIDPFRATPQANVPHISLASKADLVVVFPASANALHRLALGACSDLLSLVVAATKAPVVVFPTMNPVMFSAPAIRRNIAQLRKDGIYVVEPGLGFEVSTTSDDKLKYMGVGFGEGGITPILRAVLLDSKKIGHDEAHV